MAVAIAEPEIRQSLPMAEEFFKDMTIRYVDSVPIAEQVLQELQQYSSICLDIETSGLDPYIDRLWLAQFMGVGSQTVWVLDMQHLDIRMFKDLIESRLIVGAELKFECKWLRKYDIRPRRCYDAIITSRLLTAGKEISNSLASLSERNLGFKLDKETRNSFVMPPEFAHTRTRKWTSEQLRYAAIDVYVLPEIMLRQVEELKQLDLMRAAKVENNLVPVTSSIEYDGIKIDVDRWRSIVSWAEVQKMEAYRETCDLFPKSRGTQRLLFGAVTGLEYKINLNSKDEVMAKFKELSIDVPNLDKKILKTVHHPAVKAYMKYSEFAKMTGTYGENVIKKIHPATSRLHPLLIQLSDRGGDGEDGSDGGAATGRFSSRDPNVENIPNNDYNKYPKGDPRWENDKGEYSDKRADYSYRHAFIAEPGNMFACCDLSQIEIRILAQVSGDRNLRQIIEAGGDVHARTAALMFNKPIEECGKGSKFRSYGKTLNFAIIYGLGPKALAADLGLIDDVKDEMMAKFNTSRSRANKPTMEMIEREAIRRAKEIIGLYFKAMPDVKAYLDEAQTYPEARGYTTTLLGRRRWYQPIPPDISERDLSAILSRMQNQGKNSPIQGTCADIMKMAMVNIYHRSMDEPLYAYINGRKTFAPLVNVIHDELIQEISADQVERGGEIMLSEMIGAGQLLLPDVKVDAEIVIASQWEKG